MNEVLDMSFSLACDLLPTNDKVSISQKEYEELKGFRKYALEKYAMLDFSDDTLVIILMRCFSCEYVTNQNKMMIIKTIINEFYKIQCKELLEDSYVFNVLFHGLNKYKGIVDQTYISYVEKTCAKHEEVVYE